MIEAIGFDFDHTLGLDNKLERVVAVGLGRELAEAAGSVFEDGDGSAFDASIARYRNGETSLEETLVSYFEAFVPSVDGTRLTDVITSFRARAVQRAPEFVRPVPGAQELLARLRSARFPHAILTNGWSPLQEEKARLAGFEGAVLVSDLIGARKPSVDAFRALRDVFGCAMEAVAYVGDDPRIDVGGALEAGMVAVWFDWEGREYPAGLPPPTRRIAALSELPAALQGPSERAANPAT